MGCGFYTTEQYSHVRLAQSYDPVCTLDYVAIGLVLGLGIINLILATISLIYREWPPLKAKQPHVTFFTAIFGFLWTFASLFVNKNFDVFLPSSWNNYGWIPRYLGQVLMFSLWISFLLVRMTRLYFIFKLRRIPPNVWLILSIYLIPCIAVIIGGVASNSVRVCRVIVAKSADIVAKFAKEQQIRVPTDQITFEFDTNCLCLDWRYIISAAFGLYFCMFLTFCFLLWNVRSSFNEKRSMFTEGAVGGLGFAATLVLINTGRGYNCGSRFGQTIIITVLYSVCIWFISVPALFNRFFRKEKAEEEFRRNLGVDSKAFISANTPTSPSPWKSADTLEYNAEFYDDYYAKPPSLNSNKTP